MTDNELLYQAARASGQILCDEWDAGAKGILIGTGAGDLEVWNPLADDGDALRLAVTCFIGVEHARDYVVANGPQGDVSEDCSDVGSVSRAASLRRAIVRAAAEIGSRLP